MVLGYMHLPVTAKSKIKHAMVATIMGLAAMLAIGVTWMFAAPMVSTWMRPPVAPTVQPPLRTPTVSPTTTPMMVRF